MEPSLNFLYFRMELIAAIENPTIALRILDHLGLTARPPPRGRPWRRPNQLALEHRAADFDTIDPPPFDQ